MIKKVQIENYRCFKSAQLEPLRQINILVGDNASGKTALLEAIKLGLDGQPATLPYLNQLRCIYNGLPMGPTPEQFRTLFVDFFHQFDTNEDIIISMVDFAGKTAALRVHFDPSKAATIQTTIGFSPQQMPPSSSPPTTIVPLAFERTDFQGREDTLLATLNPQGVLLFQPGKHMGIASGFLSSSYYGGFPENASWLSQLSLEKRTEEVIHAVQRQFPFISQLTSETPLPGFASVYADVSGLSRKIPLSLVSTGISRLFTMILAVVQFKGGVLFVDEVENGIFHHGYQALWTALIDLAKHNRTQLFITTHSLECLRALVPSLRGNEEEILLLRTEREKGSSKLTLIQGKLIQAAIEQGFDVR